MNLVRFDPFSVMRDFDRLFGESIERSGINAVVVNVNLGAAHPRVRGFVKHVVEETVSALYQHRM